MRESWRNPRERATHAPETGSGAGGHEDIIDVEPTIDPETGREVWKQVDHVVRALPKPEDFRETPKDGAAKYRERPKGKGAEAKKYLKDLGDVAKGVGWGSEKVHDETAFESALSKYAEIRTRRDAQSALLGATADLDARDVASFRKRLPELEAVLVRDGFVKGETSQESSARPNADPERMTEEELLKGLEGLAPKEEAPKAPERAKGLPDGWEERLVREKDGTIYRVATNGKDELRRKATDDDRERLAASLPGMTPEEMKAPVRPERGGKNWSDPAETDEDVVDARRRGISADSKRRKQEKKKRKSAEGSKDRPTESNEEKQKRLNDVAKLYFKKILKGADPEFMYQLMENTLVKSDIDAFKAELKAEAKSEGMTMEINGTTGENIRDFSEIAANHDEAVAMLGVPDGNVGRISYWLLPDGSAAIFDRPRAGFEPSLITIREKGMHRFPLGWREYKDGAFVEVTEAEVQKRREEGIEAYKTEQEAIRARREEKPRTEETRTEAAPRAERVERAEAPDQKRERREERAEHPRDSNEKPRTLEEAKRVFFRAHNKEKKKAGKAFREAAKGLSDKNVDRLYEYLVDTTDIPKGILEGVVKSVKHEMKSEDGERDGRSRLDRDIEEDIDTMMRGERPRARARETGGNRGESAEQRLAREIDEDIAKIFAKK